MYQATSAGVLLLSDDHGILYPIAVFFQKHNAAEEIYEIYNQELGETVKTLDQWRTEYKQFSHLIEILIDHKNLEYSKTSKVLNRRQT
jgi:hypothetical protein